MKASDLKGRNVVTVEKPEHVGAVDEVVFDPDNRQIAGLKIKTPEHTTPQLIHARDIRSIGEDVVTIRDKSAMGNEGAFPELGKLPDLRELTNAKAMSQSGKVIGQISNVLIDPQRLSIEGYELGGSFWEQLTGGRKVFNATEGMHYGKGILMIPDDVAALVEGRRETAVRQERHEGSPPPTEPHPPEERPPL